MIVLSSYRRGSVLVEAGEALPHKAHLLMTYAGLFSTTTKVVFAASQNGFSLAARGAASD